MKGKYYSDDFRVSKDVRCSLTNKERQLMLILMAFGATIDPHGYDGDYAEPVTRILDLFKEIEE